MTHQGMANALGIWDWLKNGGKHPEAATMGLTWVGQFGGKREGRRFRGQYVSPCRAILSRPDACFGRAHAHAHVSTQAATFAVATRAHV